jgi:hypothetical protein
MTSSLEWQHQKCNSVALSGMNLTATSGLHRRARQVLTTPPSYGLERYKHLDATFTDLPLIVNIPDLKIIMVVG